MLAGSVSEIPRLVPLSPLLAGNVDRREGPSEAGRNPLMSLAARKWAPVRPVFGDSDSDDE